MQSSADPEKGAGLAMGLAKSGDEVVTLVDPEVLAGAGGGEVAVSLRRTASTSSWKGSGWLILVPAVLVRSSVTVQTDGDKRWLTGFI